MRRASSSRSTASRSRSSSRSRASPKASSARSKASCTFAGRSSRRVFPGMLNLDTHILLHALAGTLKPAERRLLAGDLWSISAIVRWEICKLQQLGRIELDLDMAEVARVLSRIQTWPLTWEICRESCRLDVRGDPADELIAATSIVHNVPLVTRDKVLRSSKQVPLARA